MSSVKIQGSATGTANFTIAVPDGTSTDRTINLPDVAGSFVTTGDNGTVTNAMLSGGHGGFRSMQVFASAGSATWTKPAGISFIRVYVTGGGGGGGGAQNTNYFSGQGGAGGGTAIKVIDVSSVSSVSVTVGGGGAAGAVSASYTIGGSGGSSSFGAYCSATGGGGGRTAPSLGGYSGEPGVGSGGDINLKGNSGADGSDNGTFPQKTGCGGGSFWGGGAQGIWTDTPTAGANGGGGCGGQHVNGTNFTGSNGGAGLVVVEEYA